MRDYFPTARGVWEFLKVAVLLVGGMCLLNHLIVSSVMLTDKALTPIPQLPQPTATERMRAFELEASRSENTELKRANIELEVQNAGLRLQLDELRRGAIFFPRREDVPVEDRIPPQNLPTRP